jgi:hypothetical protein
VRLRYRDRVCVCVRVRACVRVFVVRRSKRLVRNSAKILKLLGTQ